jgi:hypothetical protein
MAVSPTLPGSAGRQNRAFSAGKAVGSRKNRLALQAAKVTPSAAGKVIGSRKNRRRRIFSRQVEA